MVWYRTVNSWIERLWDSVNFYIWVVIIATLLLIFSLWFAKSAYERGFHDGATKVLGEWKQYMNMGEKNNE
jgi:hypothetical protein